ncbi:hypothetical protein DXG03_008345, partial [Asterophora parasitica]
ASWCSNGGGTNQLKSELVMVSRPRDWETPVVKEVVSKWLVKGISGKVASEKSRRGG